MNKRVFVVLWSVLIMGILGSCSSSKSLKKSYTIDGMTESDYVETIISNSEVWNALTAKMSLAINIEGKGVAKVNGTLRIKKGEIVQLSVAPFLGIEVARVEISPDGVLVIDRMNKRYVKVPFSEIESMSKVGLDFHMFEALFLNEVFLPGKEALTRHDISSFETKQTDNGVLLDVKKTKQFIFRFLTQAPEALLKESIVGLNGTPYMLLWKYDDFQKLDQKVFPVNMDISFQGIKKPISAFLHLSRLSTNADWETHTEISKKYEKVELTDILKVLLK